MGFTELKTISVRLFVVVFALTGLGHSVAMAGIGETSDFKSLWSGVVTDEIESEGAFKRLVTDYTKGPSYVAATASEPISMLRNFIKIKMRVNSLESWGGIELRFSSDADGSYNNYFAIQIPYYLDPEFNILQPQHWADLTLAMGDAKRVGTPNINKIYQIGLYVDGSGSGEAFKVDFKDFSIEQSTLPAVVSMTFDDGYDDHFDAAKIMQPFGLRGTAYVMTNELNQPGYLTYDNLKQMKNEMGWSISSHHKIPITDFTLAELDKEMQSTFKVLTGLGFGEEVFHFAYPLGKQNREKTLPYINQYFLTARVAGGGAETLPPSDWHMLRTYNVTPDKTPEMIIERIKKAKEQGEWVILMFHHFSEGKPENDLTYNIDDFKKFCEMLSKEDVFVHPVNEVYEAFQ